MNVLNNKLYLAISNEEEAPEDIEISMFNLEYEMNKIVLDIQVNS